GVALNPRLRFGLVLRWTLACASGQGCRSSGVLPGVGQLHVLFGDVAGRAGGDSVVGHPEDGVCRRPAEGLDAEILMEVA
ncbi:MAG: hypothetical protein ABIK89_23930, partial [Planctomycetota bacterium]